MYKSSKWATEYRDITYVFIAKNSNRLTKQHFHFMDSTYPNFEKKFMEHVKATQRPLLDQIGKDGHLSEASDAALKKVVSDFMASF